MSSTPIGRSHVQRLMRTGPTELPPVVPTQPKVRRAILERAAKLSANQIGAKPVDGLLMGRYIDIGRIKAPPGLHTKGKPVTAFVRGNNDISQPADPNTAQFFYLRVGEGPGAKVYGPFNFQNPVTG